MQEDQRLELLSFQPQRYPLSLVRKEILVMKTSLFRSGILILLTLLTCHSALAQRPAYSPLLQRAEKALKAQDLDHAVVLYEKLANFYPQSSEAHNRLGYAHYLKGNDPRAIFSFRRALSLSRRNDQALHNLLLASGRQADSLAHDNAFTEAASTLDELVSAYSWHPQHVVLLYYRGRMEFLRGRPDEGLRWWRKAANRAPGSGVAKVMAAQKQALNAKTVALYEEASSKVENEAAFGYLLGKRQMDASQFENAYQTLSVALDRSIKTDIPFPLLSYKFAQASLATGRNQEAIEELENAKRQRPDWASVRSLLWSSLLTDNQLGQADQALQEAFELDRKPKLAILGSPRDTVRLKTSNGSLLLIPPTGVSLSPGPISLVTENGTSQALTIRENEAIVYQVQGNTLSEQSTATLSTNTGGPGQLAPPMVAKDRRGRLYRLTESLLKQPIAILFWDVGDEEAAQQLTNLGSLVTRLGAELETVAIHTDPNTQKQAQRLYLSQPGTSAQLWGDRDTANKFGVEESPSLLLIDINGRIIMKRTGPTEELFKDLESYQSQLQ